MSWNRISVGWDKRSAVPPSSRHRMGGTALRLSYPTWLAILPAIIVLLAPGSLRHACGANDGQLTLTVVDRATGKQVPARMILRNPAGRPRLPKKVPAWEDHFVVPGQIEVEIGRAHV